MFRTSLVGAILLALFTVTAGGAAAAKPAAGTASYPIEDRYKVRGTWAVATAGVHDASGSLLYQLYYPRDLGGQPALSATRS